MQSDDVTAEHGAAQFWEDHYGRREQVWSGRVNARLAEVVADLPTGRALDLGCGEGGDAVWLAERGWQVVAVDISATALQRAASAARERKLQDRIDFQQHDLSTSFPTGVFDLVSAQFLHSPMELDRERILRRAADAVAVGGLLLVVDHASMPPWARRPAHEHRLPDLDEVMASLDLAVGQWDRVRVETAEREAAGPEGQVAVLTDNVILLRRRS